MLRRTSLALLLALLLSSSASAAPPHVRVVALDRAIDPVTADWVVDQIHAAVHAHDAAVVIELDTPGGELSAMRRITQAELRANIPVIVYVAPSGARAASAGFFLLQAADVAAMGPSTNAGSATPINGNGQNLGSDLRQKVINDAKAQIRTLADDNGRPGELAETAVEPRSASCPSCPRNWTAVEARRLQLVDALAPTLPALLTQVDGRVTPRKGLTLHVAGAVLERRTLPLRLALLDVLLDPNLLTLLFLGGLIGIAFELTHPGIVLPGLIGVSLLILSLFGLSVIPFSWAGIALLVFGAALLGLEGFVSAHGAFAGAGALACGLGSLMLFRVEDSPYGTTSVWLAIGIVIAMALLALLVLTRVIEARRRPARNDDGGVTGSAGTVVSALAPSGQVLVRGERWAAWSSAPLEPGTAVRVLSREGLSLYVEELAPDPTPTAPRSSP